jgi:hypothetical protein
MAKEIRKTRTKKSTVGVKSAVAPAAAGVPVSRPVVTQSPARPQPYDAQQYIKRDLSYSCLAAGIVFALMIVFYLTLH